MKLTGKMAGVLAASVLGLSGFATSAWAQMSNDTQGPRANPAYEGRSVQTDEQAIHDRSGTAGRMGLGASPRHPEGPGNVPSPSR